MKDMLLETAVEHFLLGYANLSTRRAYQRSLSSLIAHCGSQISLADLTPEMVDTWSYQLRDRQTVYENHPYRPQEKRGLSPYTLANHVRGVRAFFNWCVKRRYLVESPALFLKSKKPYRSQQSKAIPTSVLKQMMIDVAEKSTFCRYRDGAILAMLATYGMRCGSLTSLKVSQINFASNWITIRQKGDQDHDLPLVPSMKTVLRKWLAYRSTLNMDPPHEYVFVTNRKAAGNAHQRLTELGLQQMIYRLSEQADPDGRRWGPHSIRHWRGQSLADDRVSPKLIQQLLGHSDIKITLDSYCNQDRARLKALVEWCAIGPDV